jgi:hypothetical protein
MVIFRAICPRYLEMKIKNLTVPHESTVKATRTLISDIQFGENIPQIELHLRSAWVKGEENELLHYDLTNQPWQRIEISKKTGTWRIVESEEIARAYDTKGNEGTTTTLLPPISSTTTTTIATVNNNANNRPPLFRRYSQIPQVIPSKTHDPNIELNVSTCN